MSDFKKQSLFGLTYPLFIFMFLTAGVTFVDQMMLSSYSDDLAATVSLANQILGIAYDISGLFAVGSLILISQYLGRDEIEEAKNVAAASMKISLFFCFGLAAILDLGAPYFVDWVDVPKSIRSDVLLYIYIISIAMMFNGFISAATSVMRGFGHTLEILVLGILVNIVYLSLEYVLLFGYGPIPSMGVKGSALATLIVRGCMIFGIFFVVQYRIGINIFAKVKSFKKINLRIFNLSFPSVAEGVAYNSYQLTMVSFIAYLGTEAILVRSYTNTIISIIPMMVFVLSQGNEILVGYDRGAGENDLAVKRAMKTSLYMALVVTALSVVLWWQGLNLITLFTEDAFIDEGVLHVLAISILIAPFNAINIILFSSLKAVGDVRRPVVYNLLITYLVALPLGYIFVKELSLGVEGLYYAYLVEEFIKAFGMIGFWLRRKWLAYDPVV